MSNDLLTTAHAGNRLGVSRSRVLALIRAERLPATKIGREWLIRSSDLSTVADRPSGRPRSSAPRHGEPQMRTPPATVSATPVPSARAASAAVPAMKVVAIGAGKGGVGKTTTVLYLAARAAEYYHSTAAHPTVCIIDRDESQNLTDMAITQPHAFAPGVRLLPGTAIPPRDSGYRMVFIDTPPGISALDALRNADYLVVPAIAEHQSIGNLKKYLEMVQGLRRTVNTQLQLLAIIPTIVERRNPLHRDMLEAIDQVAARHLLPLHILPAVPRGNRIARYDLRATGYDAAAKELFRALK